MPLGLAALSTSFPDHFPSFVIAVPMIPSMHAFLAPPSIVHPCSGVLIFPPFLRICGFEPDVISPTIWIRAPINPAIVAPSFPGEPHANLARLAMAVTPMLHLPHLLLHDPYPSI